jgi:hypothetical protein
MLSSCEKQRNFKEKMYKAGLKQIILWVKSIEKKRIAKIKQSEFLRRLRKLTAEWKDDDLSELFNLFIRIIEGKKEVMRLKKK